MPSWQSKLIRRQIHAIMGYFISLAAGPEEDAGEDGSDSTI
jgi:hypothetical protein